MSSGPPEPPAALPEGDPAPRHRSLVDRLMWGLVAILLATLSLYFVYVQTVTVGVIEGHLASSVSASWNRAAMQVADTRPEDLHPLPPVEEGATVQLDGADPGHPGVLAQPAGTLVGLVSRTGLAEHSGSALQAAVLQPGGELRLLSDEERHAVVHAVAPLTQGQQTTVTADGVEYRIQAGEVERAGPWLDSETVLVVGMPTSESHAARWSGFAQILVGVLAILASTLLLGRWWVARALRPLGEVAGVAADVARRDLASSAVDLSRARVPSRVLEGSDEVALVGGALNRMVDSVDDALQRRRADEAELRRFVADASHELRTPLASVRGYAEMLALTEPLSPNGRRSVERVLSQADRMTHLVDSMLVLARLESGVRARAAGLDQDAGGAVGIVDLCEVVLDGVMDARAAWPDHRWVVDMPDQVESPGYGVPGDEDRVTRIVVNLLSNAAKHTPPGTTVTVSLRRTGDATSPGARMRVHDNGGGIPVQALPDLFRSFVRGVGAHAAREHSTGLGLPIVRSAARSLGGDVQVASEPGWTRVDVDLPLVRREGPAPAPTPNPARRSLRR